ARSRAAEVEQAVQKRVGMNESLRSVEEKSPGQPGHGQAAPDVRSRCRQLRVENRLQDDGRSAVPGGHPRRPAHQGVPVYSFFTDTQQQSLFGKWAGRAPIDPWEVKVEALV